VEESDLYLFEKLPVTLLKSITHLNETTAITNKLDVQLKKIISGSKKTGVQLTIYCNRKNHWPKLNNCKMQPFASSKPY
jgi:hypothetical protein